MLPKQPFSQTQSYLLLEKHFQEIKDLKMKDLFAQDPDRFGRMSLSLEDELLFDFSKNRITYHTLDLLTALAKECRLADAIEAMFTGKKINETEQRSVLHIALRNISGHAIEVDGQNVMPEVCRVLQQIETFSNKIISGEWKGYTGKPIRHVVNIGIGGSDLGAKMVCEALKAYQQNHIRTHFVSNIDAVDLLETLKEVDFESTLFIIASKTFTTQETMTNAFSARKLFLQSGASEHDIEKHFVAVSTNAAEVAKFGINAANMFEFWDWVGGRYSLWSAVGLSIACGLGFDHFKQLLLGAHRADQHFRESSFDKNIPVIMALLGIWYNNFFGTETHAVLPYDEYLHRLTAYLQQGDMESNGKGIDRNGEKVCYQTGSIIWGESGSNGQHAFYQLIHQGTKIIPADFIASAQAPHELPKHHNILLANFFAQTEALLFGKDAAKASAEMKAEGKDETEIAQLLPFKIFEGNRPSNSILLKKLSPYSLGMLVALYEHKIFTQGVIWNVYSFDQWGVELGKQLAKRIENELDNPQPIATHDSSTNGLINQYKKWR